jgi:hypothetical protein
MTWVQAARDVFKHMNAMAQFIPARASARTERGEPRWLA